MANDILRVTALVEDTPAEGMEGRVRGEHGLALLVEAHGKRVLFDTGAAGAVCANADALGLGSALADLDAVVLSHGHYDHTGGLAHVLGHSERQLPVFARPGLFTPKAHGGNGATREIGIPTTKSQIDGAGGRVFEEDGSRQILRHFTVSGQIRPDEGDEWVNDRLCVRGADGELVPDTFPEEQALSISTPGRGIVVLVGCAHRGLVNNVETALQACGAERVRAVFGGAHLGAGSDERIRRTVDALARLDPESIVLGHCTGSAAETQFAEAFGERFQPLRAGGSWSLEFE